MRSESASPAIAQTLDRGLQILEAVARSENPMSVADAAADCDLDRTVTHRLVATLFARGYLHREGDGGYRIGPTCLALASTISDLRTVARPALEILAEKSGETVALAVLSGREMVFLDGIESSRRLRVVDRSGHLLPAHSTSVGKAWLAALPSAQLDQLYGHSELIAVTDRTITSRTTLDAELADIRAKGYATSHGESEDGVGSIGVSVLNDAGEPRAALSVAMPLARFDPGVERETLAILSDVATSLGAKL